MNDVRILTKVEEGLISNINYFVVKKRKKTEEEKTDEPNTLSPLRLPLMRIIRHPREIHVRQRVHPRNARIRIVLVRRPVLVDELRQIEHGALVHAHGDGRVAHDVLEALAELEHRPAHHARVRPQPLVQRRQRARGRVEVHRPVAE